MLVIRMDNEALGLRTCMRTKEGPNRAMHRRAGAQDFFRDEINLWHVSLSAHILPS